MKHQSTFDCIFCPAKMFGRSQASWVLMLANHIYGYYPDAVTTRIGEFKSLYCTETFFEASCRLRHIDELHAEQKAARVCPVCEESFTIPQLLYAHVDVKHPQVLNRQRTQACPLCPHMTFDTKALRGHIDICHSNLKDSLRFAAFCATNSSLIRLRCGITRGTVTGNAGSADWDMKCDHCDFTTDSSRGLLVHLQKKHGIMTGSRAGSD
jgi:hypothetical protein